MEFGKTVYITHVPKNVVNFNLILSSDGPDLDLNVYTVDENGEKDKCIFGYIKYCDTDQPKEEIFNGHKIVLSGNGPFGNVKRSSLLN